MPVQLRCTANELTVSVRFSSVQLHCSVQALKLTQVYPGSRQPCALYVVTHTTSMETQSGSRVLNTKPRFLAANTRARSSEISAIRTSLISFTTSELRMLTPDNTAVQLGEINKSPAVTRVSRPYSWCTLATCIHNCPR